MPSGVYIRTELNATGFKKGHTLFRTKESYTNDEYRKQLSSSLQKKWDSGTRSKNTNKGKHWKIKDSSNMNKDKIGKPSKLKGKNITEEHRKNISLSHIGLNTWMKGKKRTLETRLKISKSHKDKNLCKHNRDINLAIRNGIEIRLWREAVFARDNWTCQKTGIKGGKLHSHHIQNFAQYPELRFAIDNGITLSKEAHREFHKKYGIKNNTREQINEFIK
jgi:hypothetical protein